MDKEDHAVVRDCSINHMRHQRNKKNTGKIQILMKKKKKTKSIQ